MYVKIGLIMALPFIIWGFIKLFRSPKYDKWCKDLASGKLNTDTTSKDMMKGISKSEIDLGKRSEENIKQAKQLEKEAENNKEFLSKRGVVEEDAKAEESKEVSE